jgi:hypothetical protein
VALAYFLPLWKMTLEAPQYLASLRLRAYENRVEGDRRQSDIINHYVGMKPIDTIPAPEMGPSRTRFWIWLSLRSRVLSLRAPAARDSVDRRHRRRHPKISSSGFGTSEPDPHHTASANTPCKNPHLDEPARRLRSRTLSSQKPLFLPGSADLCGKLQA